MTITDRSGEGASRNTVTDWVNGLGLNDAE